MESYMSKGVWTQIRNVRVVEVIRVSGVTGKGLANDDPVREVIEYWTKDGKLIARHDQLDRTDYIDSMPR